MFSAYTYNISVLEIIELIRYLTCCSTSPSSHVYGCVLIVDVNDIYV